MDNYSIASSSSDWSTTDSSTSFEDEECETRKQEFFLYKTHTDRFFEVLKSLREVKMFCDIQLEANDGEIIYGHKVVLASASPYLSTCFLEHKNDYMFIEKFDNTVLKPIVDYMYTAQIMITEDNARDLFSAAYHFQLQYLQEACSNFLQISLKHINCIGTKKLADLYNCIELSYKAESFIYLNFTMVIECDEFINLTHKQVIQLICSDKVTVLSEEVVFESVIRWVNYNFNLRKNFLIKIMKYVRVPFLSRQYLWEKIREQPIKNIPKCKKYLSKAIELPRCKIHCSQPRPQPDFFTKVILAIGGQPSDSKILLEWYDPIRMQWKFRCEQTPNKYTKRYCVMDRHNVVALGTNYQTSNFDYYLAFLSSCIRFTNLNVNRGRFAHAIMDNFIYIVGGEDNNCVLADVELYEFYNFHKRKISNMCTARKALSLGVLNHLIYAIGGIGGLGHCLQSVECYDPKTDKWTPVAEMSKCRCYAGVGILDDRIYVVGGYDNDETYYKSVEMYNPSTDVWNSIPDMHKCRSGAGVVAFDGFLYVVGGYDGVLYLSSIEIYNPYTNKWSISTKPAMNFGRRNPEVAVVANYRAHNFKT